MASGAASLDNELIPLSTLRRHAQTALVDILDEARGRKGMVIDPRLLGPLNLIAEVSMLRDHGVEKLYTLSTDGLESECPNLIYLVRPQVDNMRMIAKHILAHSRKMEEKEYWVVLVPRKTLICENILEEEGVYGNVTLKEIQLDLIPFDSDIVSLEMESAYRECFLDGDRTSLYYVIRSLMRLQSLFGVIPSIKGAGKCSRFIAEKMIKNRRFMSKSDGTTQPEIRQLILIDRDCDHVTPMLTQLTYEGLIDELFGIANSYISVDPDEIPVPGKTKPGQKSVKLALNSNDKLYSEIRDLTFAVLAPLLSKKAKFISENYNERHQAHTVSQIRDFMKKLNSLQQQHLSLRTHTSLAELIMNITKERPFHERLECEQSILLGSSESKIEAYIEECIGRRKPLLKVLRLLCLYSSVNNGFKAKQYDFFRREVLQTYGSHHLFTLHNLEKIGLLKRNETRSTWPSLRRSLKLWVDELDETDPRDIAYAYAGYAPLSVRLVQQAVRGAPFRPDNDALKFVPGGVFEETQELEGAPTPTAESAAEDKQARHIVMVYFVGGVTFAEIAALRFLSNMLQEDGIQREFVIATTKLITGDSLLDPILADFSKGGPQAAQE